MVAFTDQKTRMFELMTNIADMVIRKKRNPKEVADVLQVIKEKPDFEQVLFPSATGPTPRKAGKDTRAQKAARLIMGKNFLGIEEVQQHFGVRFSRKELAQLAEIPWSKQELQECRDTHVLFVGYPLCILDIRDNKAPKGTFYSYVNAWYNSQSFARNENSLRWYLIRKEAVKGSFDKTCAEQTQLLNENEEVPRAVEVVYMITLYYLVNNIRLFENYYVRCQDLDSHGGRVDVGNFGRNGLNVDDCWVDGRGSYIGLAVSRKFQN